VLDEDSAKGPAGRVSVPGHDLDLLAEDSFKVLEDWALDEDPQGDCDLCEGLFKLFFSGPRLPSFFMAAFSTSFTFVSTWRVFLSRPCRVVCRSVGYVTPIVK